MSVVAPPIVACAGVAGVIRGQSGVGLGLIWDRSALGRFGVDSESLWGCLGADLGSIWGRSGVAEVWASSPELGPMLTNFGAICANSGRCGGKCAARPWPKFGRTRQGFAIFSPKLDQQSSASLVGVGPSSAKSRPKFGKTWPTSGKGQSNSADVVPHVSKFGPDGAKVGQQRASFGRTRAHVFAEAPSALQTEAESIGRFVDEYFSLVQTFSAGYYAPNPKAEDFSADDVADGLSMLRLEMRRTRAGAMDFVGMVMV